jgi:hypothetical protein
MGITDLLTERGKPVLYKTRLLMIGRHVRLWPGRSILMDDMAISYLVGLKRILKTKDGVFG